jgi:hypothetical protein
LGALAILTAALALILLSPIVKPALAQCAESPAGTENCTGNVSSGANFANPPTDITILNVNSLNANIAPASGTGISLKSSEPYPGDGNSGINASSVTINFTDTTHSVTTSGASGVLGESIGGGGGNGNDLAIPTDHAQSGGTGGAVMVTTQGPVTSSGAAAVAAESIGGSGGSGDTGESGASGASSLGVQITVERTRLASLH